MIDADALLAEYDRVHIGEPGKARKLIEDAPTVDAVEVVHGHWIETEEGTICSECHEHPFSDGYFAIANYNGDWCPNCGAKMDGERR